MADLDLQVKGIKELEAKMGRVLEPAKTTVSDLARFVQAKADEFAKPHPADKGTLGKTVKMDLAPGPLPLWAEVYTRSGIAVTVEYGRLPGKPPPMARIATWLISHGFGTKDDAFRVAQEIRAHGTKGIYFMRKAREAGQEKAGQLLALLAREIEGRWGKG